MVKTDIKYLGKTKPEHYEEKEDGFVVSVGIFEATKSDALGNMKPGWYSFKYKFDETEMDYHIGYARHMEMREALAQLCDTYKPSRDKSIFLSGVAPYMVGAVEKQCGPFYEFIVASDVGCVFMTPVCEKLAKDFENFHNEAQNYFSNDQFNGWMKKYDALHYLFNKAACNHGAVVLG